MAVQLKSSRLTQFGFRPLEVLDAIEVAFQGEVVAQIYEGNRVFDVAVILEPGVRKDPETIGALLLQNSQGLRLPLRELAEIYSTTGRYSILHEGARRRQTVSCNVRGRDVASFVNEAKQKISQKISLSKGVYFVYSGAAEAQWTHVR